MNGQYQNKSTRATVTNSAIKINITFTFYKVKQCFDG